MNMKTNKYKILVLTDLKDSTKNVLRSTANLCKMIDGDVSLFHVKNPIDIVERESQLSAFRNISEKQTATKKQIEKFVSQIKEEHNLVVQYSYTFGNVKNEIEDYIIKHKPDIIVLGKRKSKLFSFGDNVTDFVLNAFDGIVLISGNDNPVEFNEEISLGLLDSNNPFEDIGFTNKLMKQTKQPLKAFKVVNKGNNLPKTTNNSISKMVEYVFERSDSTVPNLTNYLSKSNINLLLIDGNFRNTNKNTGLNQSDVKNVINQLDMSLLISNNKNFSKIS